MNQDHNLREVAQKVIVKGARGFSNKQMLETMRNLFDGKITEYPKEVVLEALYTEYKHVFESSAKYMPDLQKVELERFLQKKPGMENFELKIGKRIRNMMEDGIDPLAADAKEQHDRFLNGETEPAAEEPKADETEETVAETAEETAETVEETVEEYTILTDESTEETSEVSEINFATDFKSENAEKLANIVKGNNDWKSVLDEKEVEMTIMAVEGKSATEIAAEFDMKAGTVRDQLYKNASSVLNKLTA